MIILPAGAAFDTISGLMPSTSVCEVCHILGHGARYLRRPASGQGETIGRSSPRCGTERVWLRDNATAGLRDGFRRPARSQSMQHGRRLGGRHPLNHHTCRHVTLADIEVSSSLIGSRCSIPQAALKPCGIGADRRRPVRCRSSRQGTVQICSDTPSNPTRCSRSRYVRTRCRLYGAAPWSSRPIFPATTSTGVKSSGRSRSARDQA